MTSDPVPAEAAPAPASPLHSSTPVSAPSVSALDVSAVGQRQASRVRAVGIALLAGLFVLLMDAQWLKIDDFGMSNDLGTRPLGSLLADIVTTRTTPHLRFSFLHHLVLLPVFRWGDTSRAAINLLYLGTAAFLLAGGLWLARPLARRPLLWGAAWLAFAAVAISIPVRQTFEFKTANYLLFCFSMCAALVAFGWRLLSEEAPPLRRQLLWCLLALGCLHMAEVGLFAVACVGFALALQRRLWWRLLLATLVWPFAYWGANKLFFPRPVNLLEHRDPKALSVVLGNSWKVLWTEWPAELVLAVVLLLAAGAVAFARSRPGARLVATLGALGLGGALAAAGIAVVVLSQASYLWVGERHIAFAGLGLMGTALVSAGLLVRQGLRGWGAAVLAGALALVGARGVYDRLPRLLSYADARRQELADSFFVQAYVQMQAAWMTERGEQKELLVFIPRWLTWSDRRDYLDPSFMGASWTLNEFSRGFSCPEKRVCPRVTWVPNLTDGFRTKLDRAQQVELCGRMRNARVMVLRSSLAHEPPPPELPAGFSDEQCMAWLTAGELITPG